MTIYDCSWGEFLNTARDASWSQWFAAICFGVAWAFSIKKMLRTREIAGKSSWFLWFTILGCVFSIWRELFVELDIFVLLYLYLLAVVCAEFYQYSKVSRDERERRSLDARKAALEARGSRLRGMGSHSDRGGDADRRRHHHRHRRDDEKTNDLSESRSSVAVKEPMFEDSVVFDGTPET